MTRGVHSRDPQPTCFQEIEPEWRGMAWYRLRNHRGPISRPLLRWQERHIACDDYRRNARYTALVHAYAAVSSLSREPPLSPEDLATLHERLRLVSRLIERLHPTYAEALLMWIDVEDGPRCAQALGISYALFRQRLARARRALRAALATPKVVSNGKGIA